MRVDHKHMFLGIALFFSGFQFLQEMWPVYWNRGKSQAPGGTNSSGCPYTAAVWLLQLCPWPRTPCQPPGAISLCPTDTIAERVPSSSQPCPDQRGHVNPNPPVGPDPGPASVPPEQLMVPRAEAVHVHSQMPCFWLGVEWTLAAKFYPIENPWCQPCCDMAKKTAGCCTNTVWPQYCVAAWGMNEEVPDQAQRTVFFYE